MKELRLRSFTAPVEIAREIVHVSQGQVLVEAQRVSLARLQRYVDERHLEFDVVDVLWGSHRVTREDDRMRELVVLTSHVPARVIEYGPLEQLDRVIEFTAARARERFDELARKLGLNTLRN